jgi:hypothetical protein
MCYVEARVLKKDIFTIDYAMVGTNMGKAQVTFICPMLGRQVSSVSD